MNSETNTASAPLTQDPLDGASAAAIMLLLLDEADAAHILKQLEPDEVRAIGTAMYAASGANESRIDAALEQFMVGTRRVPSLAVGAEPRIRKLMNEALGNVRADNVLAAIAPQSSANALEILRWMDVEDVAAVVSEEHPQVGAIILSVLTPAAAGQVLETLDEKVQADLILRAARLESIPAEAVSDLEAVLARATDRPGKGPEIKLGGATDIARIVNNLTRPTSERVLKTIKKHDKTLGQIIEDEMFVFDNLNDLDDKALGAVLRAADSSQIALALRGASEPLIDKMLNTMSARAAQTIRDEMMDAQMVKRADVEDAQKAIIAVARKLASDGQIILGGQSDDYV